jgi:hypothetical protein
MNEETNEFTKKEIIAGLFVVISVTVLVIFILLARGLDRQQAQRFTMPDSKIHWD